MGKKFRIAQIKKNQKKMDVHSTVIVKFFKKRQKMNVAKKKQFRITTQHAQKI